jgi:hypothetical protein
MNLKNNNAPIRWIDSKVNPATYQGNNLRRHADGRVERLPAFAHDGNHDNHTVNEASRRRYRTMICHAGFERSVVHSNAAAHIAIIEHHRFSVDGYARHVLNKTYQLGWIDVDAGCLLLQIDQGLVNEKKLLVPTDTARRCMPGTPCEHIAAERAERARRHAALMAKWDSDLAGEAPETKLALAIADALEARDAKRAAKRGTKKPTDE